MHATLIRFLLVQPSATGPLRFRRAAVVGAYETAQEAFADRDRYLGLLADQGIRHEALQFYVVDVHRRLVARPGTKTCSGPAGAAADGVGATTPVPAMSTTRSGDRRHRDKTRPVEHVRDVEVRDTRRASV